MEILIGTLIGILVAFIGIFMYRQGVKDGRSVKENKPLEKVIPTTSKDPEPDENLIQFENLMNYQPQFTEVKHENN